MDIHSSQFLTEKEVAGLTIHGLRVVQQAGQQSV